MMGLKQGVSATLAALAFTGLAAAGDQQVVYNPGAPWAIITLPNGCVFAVSTLMDEWADGVGTFAWSGGCSTKGFIEGEGTLSRTYKGREYGAGGKVEIFEREWHMHAEAVSGLMHGVGTKSYGGPEREQFKFTYGCSQYADGAGGWTPPIANCLAEVGEMIAKEIAKTGGPAAFEMFKQPPEQRQ